MSVKVRTILLLSLLFVLPILALVARVAPGRADQAHHLVLPVVVSSPDYDILLDDGRATPHVLPVATGKVVRWANGDVDTITLATAGGVFGAIIPAGGRYDWPTGAAGIFPYTATGTTQAEGAVIVSANGAADWFDGRTAREAYRDSCGGCHGPNREGAVGPALVPANLPQNDAFYLDTIKNGRPGTLMPSWKYIYSEEEMWLLLGFLRSPVDEDQTQWGMDEIAASRAELVDEATLPAGPTHDGNMDNLMLVTEREAERIAVFDGDTHTLLGRIPTGYRAHGYAFDPTNERWAFNISRDGWLYKIDLYSLQPVTRIRVGVDSRGLAVSDDGNYLIAGNFDPPTAVILDAQTLDPLKVIETEGYDPDGRWVRSRVAITSDTAPELVGPYFLIALKEAGQVWRIDYSQPDFPIVKATGVGRILHDGFLSPDNRQFYIAAQKDNVMAVVDVASMTTTARIPTGDTPHPGSGATWTVGGKTYGATVHAGEGLVTVWDLALNQIVAKISTSGPGLFIRVHEDNPYIWADTMAGVTPNEIYVIDKETFEVVRVIDDGQQALHPELTDDGQFVYISDWQGEMLRVYDAMTFQLLIEIDALETPTGIFNTSRRHEKLGH